ncbi:MAG TPA: nitrous oxide reductase accessory protein NosL [Vicinamibacterales bacterium]|jgi:hypothetical protein
MRTLVALGVGLFLLVACASVQPVAIRVGDVCDGCRRPITNAKIAAELVPPSGLPLKFRTVTCMARYIKEHQVSASEVFVTDYGSGRLIHVRSAVFVKSEIDDRTKELDYYAFGDVASAVAFGKKSGGSATDWPGILQRIAAGGAD